MKNKVTEFLIEPKYLEKWLHQNKAEYTDCYVEGCLLDNFVVETKRGFAAVYEKYVNEWMSIYHVYFEPGEAPDIFNGWYKFEEAMEQEQE